MTAGDPVDVLRPTVVEESPAGRIIVADSLTFFEKGDWPTDVVHGEGTLPMRRSQRRSKRSRSMTLSHAATKSRTNFACASPEA